MKINDITETMKTGSSEKDLEQIFNHLVKTYYHNAKHIGDMGFIKVYYLLL